MRVHHLLIFYKKMVIFRKHVFNLSVKLLCETKWECKTDGVKALRYQADDAMIKNKAETLYETLKWYKFLVLFVLWYDKLFQINLVSKELQSKKVNLSTAMDSFNNLMTWLRKLEVDGFVQIHITAKELAEDIEVVAVFPAKR